MPYKIVGSRIYHKKGGRWMLKQRCRSHSHAVKALRLLHYLEYSRRR